MLWKIPLGYEILKSCSSQGHWNFSVFLISLKYMAMIKFTRAVDLPKWQCLKIFKVVHCFIPHFNTLRPRQNGSHFPDDIFKCIFLNGNVRISIKISLKFVPNGPINKIPALVQVMAWRSSGDKPLSDPIMVSLLMHICVTRPQWVNGHLITYPRWD